MEEATARRNYKSLRGAAPELEAHAGAGHSDPQGDPGARNLAGVVGEEVWRVAHDRR